MTETLRAFDEEARMINVTVAEADRMRDERRFVELNALKRRGVATWSDERELGELERRMTLRDARRFARKGDSGDG